MWKKPSFFKRKMPLLPDASGFTRFKKLSAIEKTRAQDYTGKVSKFREFSPSVSGASSVSEFLKSPTKPPAQQQVVPCDDTQPVIVNFNWTSSATSQTVCARSKFVFQLRNVSAGEFDFIFRFRSLVDYNFENSILTVSNPAGIEIIDRDFSNTNYADFYTDEVLDPLGPNYNLTLTLANGPLQALTIQTIST